ncbi:MAG: class I SAM-dependent methyltransferase [Spirochaetota bacterium]
MPAVELWDTFFDPAAVLPRMGVDRDIDLLIDIGCGYGTFILPAASMVKRVLGIDIDPGMIDHCRKMIAEQDRANIDLLLDDVSTGSCDAYRGSADYVSLFNILHCEDPVSLLWKARSLAKPNGRIGVIHWKYEKTPRGPSMEIRPRPEQIIDWAASIGLRLDTQVDLPPYHFGLIFKIV